MCAYSVCISSPVLLITNVSLALVWLFFEIRSFTITFIAIDLGQEVSVSMAAHNKGSSASYLDNIL